MSSLLQKLGDQEEAKSPRTEAKISLEDVCDNQSLPVETPALLAEHMDRLRPRYGKLFSPSDFEMFAMLPINETQRDRLVTLLISQSAPAQVNLPQ